MRVFEIDVLVWAPDVILQNPELTWRRDGPDALAVSVGTGEDVAEVLLEFDGDGRIASASAHDRPRSEKGLFIPTPWRGRFSGYSGRAGRWIPTFGEVAWEIDGSEFVYWQGQVVTWELSSPRGDGP